MAQAKKKQSTKTAKKTTAKSTAARSKTSTRTNKKQQQSEKMHVYIVTAMSMIAAILLCANVAMMMV